MVNIMLKGKSPAINEIVVRGISWNKDIVVNWDLKHFLKVVSSYPEYKDLSDDEKQKDYSLLTGKKLKKITNE